MLNTQWVNLQLVTQKVDITPVDTAEAVIYEKKSYSLQFAVNDAISISYGIDEIDQGTR